jgi:RNA polymerase sigma-70 factor (family 1)
MFELPKYADKELVEMIFAGRQDALDQLFRRYYSRLFAYARQITNDVHAAEDIVQEIFYQLWLTHEKIPVITSVHAYLKVTTLHYAIDYLRKNKSGKTIRLDAIQLIENEDLYIELSQYQSDIVITRELSIAIQKSIELLPDQCRMVFRLSRTFGMKNSEIAVHLDISLKTVEKHMSKALSHLRSDLKKFLTILPFLFFFD